MSDLIAPEVLSFPERADPDGSWQRRLERRLLALPASLRHRRVQRRCERLLAQAQSAHDSAGSARSALRRTGLSDRALALWCHESMALGMSACTLRGALALVWGHAVQCDGEDAQLDVVAAACQAVVFSGQRVHVAVEAGEAVALEQRLAWLGVASARLAEQLTREQRAAAYRAPVLIGAPRALILDYLGDRLRNPGPRGEIAGRLRRLVGRGGTGARYSRGLPFAIVIGARRLLIDQAVEPVTLVGRSNPAQEQRWAQQALALASGLEAGTHYRVEAGSDAVITAAGQEALARLAEPMPGAWRNTARRTEGVTLALRALHLRRDEHYRRVEQRLELSGSVQGAAGLLQLLQAREGVPVTGRAQVRARLSVQRYFNRYLRLAAIDGDLGESRSELWQVYGLAHYPLSAPQDSPAPAPALTDSDQRLLARVGARSPGAAVRLEKLLGRLRRRQQLKSGQRLRAALLQLDNQADTLTAFTGKPE